MTSGGRTTTWCTITSYFPGAPASFICMVSLVTLEPDYRCTLEKNPPTLCARSLTSAMYACCRSGARSWQAQLCIYCTLKLVCRACAGTAARIWPFAHAGWASMKGRAAHPPKWPSCVRGSACGSIFFSNGAARALWRVLGPWNGMFLTSGQQNRFSFHFRQQSRRPARSMAVLAAGRRSRGTRHGRRNTGYGRGWRPSNSSREACCRDPSRSFVCSAREPSQKKRLWHTRQSLDASALTQRVHLVVSGAITGRFQRNYFCARDGTEEVRWNARTKKEPLTLCARSRSWRKGSGSAHLVVRRPR